jgi:hypothetical protein
MDGKATLYALTIQQPFASAIAYGPKRVENRLWAPSQRPPFMLAIHAAKNTAPCEPDGLEATVDAIACSAWPTIRTTPWPRSAVIAVCRVTRIVPVETYEADCPREQLVWAHGPTCIELDQVVALPRPIPAQGQRGIWIVQGNLLSAVRAAYTEAKGAHRGQ